ncbi:MAG: hypothetical protein JWQ71_1308 [Pedosphaera sp.]|nr:hypothetical protein [Pedosphaera sp.]
MLECGLNKIAIRTLIRSLVRGRLAVGIILAIATSASGALMESDTTLASARQLYNEGTQKFREGKLREAEASLQSAVASQNDTVQIAALYNLGHVRFRAGLEELKAGPNGKNAEALGNQAYEMGGGAIRAADEALAGEDIKAMVAAYQRGRGARKELKAASEAVKLAMASHGNVLTKWQRATGDFKSAYELHPSDTDAKINADVVDRNIAKLVDEQKMMMKCQSNMGKEREELKQKMKALKGKIPADMGEKLKGGDEEDDEEDDSKTPKEPKPGEKEGPSKDGKEDKKSLTPDEAVRLLGMLRLDGNRKLSMGMTDTATPKDRKGRDW